MPGGGGWWCFSFSVAPKITSQGGDEELTRGDNFKLECKATGTPTPDVQWKRNGDYDPRQTRVNHNGDHHLISSYPCNVL